MPVSYKILDDRGSIFYWNFSGNWTKNEYIEQLQAAVNAYTKLATASDRVAIIMDLTNNARSNTSLLTMFAPVRTRFGVNPSVVIVVGDLFSRSLAKTYVRINEGLPFPLYTAANLAEARLMVAEFQAARKNRVASQG
ncbi:MAG: hypothetical protein KC708_00880 [Anaerolineae bacterium]|nr:hypothetical protein [Anaerolineae bacterium]